MNTAELVDEVAAQTGMANSARGCCRGGQGRPSGNVARLRPIHGARSRRTPGPQPGNRGDDRDRRLAQAGVHRRQATTGPATPPVGVGPLPRNRRLPSRNAWRPVSASGRPPGRWASAAELCSDQGGAGSPRFQDVTRYVPRRVRLPPCWFPSDLRCPWRNHPAAATLSERVAAELVTEAAKQVQPSFL
jgi:hypothetical protein